MGIEEMILNFGGNIEYYVIFMSKLAISKIYMSTLEIFSNIKIAPVNFAYESASERCAKDG